MKKSKRSEAGEKLEAPADKKSPPEAESFGPWLRRQREVREIDLREIAEASKISLRYLQAFEENRFDALPAELFARNYLRQYAKYTGLDAEEVINYYLTARQAAGAAEIPEDTRAIRTVAASRRRTASNRRFILVIFLIIAGLVLAIRQLALWQERDGSDAHAVESPILKEIANTEKPALPSPNPEDVTAPSAGGEAGSPEISTEPAEVKVQSPIRINIEFSGQCWVEATVDGERKVAEMRVQGEVLAADAQELIELKLGDYRRAQISINGKSLVLGPDSSGSVVRNLRFDLAYVAQFTGVAVETLQARAAGTASPPPPPDIKPAAAASTGGRI